MTTIKQSIQNINWPAVTDSMNDNGYALIRGLISDEECSNLIANYSNNSLYRKTVIMERYRYGLGEYRYFNYPLPPLVQQIREAVYPQLAPIANNWMTALNIQTTFPDTFAELQQLCHSNNQVKPTALILKYGKGGFNTLHQDLYGDVYFPMQLVIFLSEPDSDYTGGEFVLTEQIPRAQSKAIVLKPRKGDVLIFTTNFRPVKGAKGYYRVNMKHGVSQLQSGERYTLGVIFHDALS
ncbi:2OG-Fe(II) oxygenase [Mucilaginibacter sp. L3T2-6]|uniref:2OG-Fe(II) oxygenase n=1 Tax=Mucilaginibacter sp. L3T2-6 TaxID=3062491 RepID=UPI0026767581|nr:2OG-Fe(II) oxygenase [Mucilaginibacter sp. L3T2-6]MDO3643173.1 2OG-Fe(II) oxygenase [Mucilaginibacter sp. L3T2-6]MDV6215497.1 2OG-Fe(II) oxygenase [Mucilaginibacter sp. L3T2-6]